MDRDIITKARIKLMPKAEHQTIKPTFVSDGYIELQQQNQQQQ